MSGAIAASVAGPLIGNLIGGSQGASPQQQAQAASPYTGQYQQWDQPLANLVNNPSSVTSTPGYNFNLNTGIDTVNRGMAGQGLLGSGNQATALTKFGQDYATNTYQQQLGNLMQLSGVNYGSPGQASQALANGASNSAAFGGTLGNLLGTGINNYMNTSNNSGWGGTTNIPSGFGASYGNVQTIDPNTGQPL